MERHKDMHVVWGSQVSIHMDKGRSNLKEAIATYVCLLQDLGNAAGPRIYCRRDGAWPGILFLICQPTGGQVFTYVTVEHEKAVNYLVS